MYLALSLASSKGLCIIINSQFEIQALREWDERDTLDHWKVLDKSILEIFEEAKIQSSQIQKIFCVQGPGAYTGLRIASSYAQGMAMALGIDIIGVPTFDLNIKGTSFIIPQRHQRARDLSWAVAKAQGYEFLKIEDTNQAFLVEVSESDSKWGFSDSENILWPTAEQLLHAVKLNYSKNTSFSLFYGLGAKVFGKYLT